MFARSPKYSPGLLDMRISPERSTSAGGTCRSQKSSFFKARRGLGGALGAPWRKKPLKKSRKVLTKIHPKSKGTPRFAHGGHQKSIKSHFPHARFWGKVGVGHFRVFADPPKGVPSDPRGRPEPPLGSKLCVKCALVKIVIFLQENLTLAGTGGLGPLPWRAPGVKK